MSLDDCNSCQKKKTCKSCFLITGGQKIDIRTLIRCTVLPELWIIFRRITTISPVSESGYTLLNAGTYLDGCNLPEISHEDFWSTMMYFLKRLNENFTAKRKAQLANQKR